MLCHERSVRRVARNNIDISRLWTFAKLVLESELKFMWVVSLVHMPKRRCIRFKTVYWPKKLRIGVELVLNRFSHQVGFRSRTSAFSWKKIFYGKVEEFLKVDR